MKRFLTIGAVCSLVACMACSCASQSPQLYAWGKRSQTGVNVCSSYENDVYSYYKTRTPEAARRLADTYDYMIAHAGGTRKVVPPGICAEYGFFLLQEETLDALCAEEARTKGRTVLTREEYYQKGLAMLEMEMKLYPQSRVLIEPILQQAKL